MEALVAKVSEMMKASAEALGRGKDGLSRPNLSHGRRAFGRTGRRTQLIDQLAGAGTGGVGAVKHLTK